LRTIDLSAATPRAPAGLTVAPASDGSGARRFYIVDRRIDNNSDPALIDGKLYEMTAPDPLPPGFNTAAGQCRRRSSGHLAQHHYACWHSE